MEHVPPDVFGEDYLYFYEAWLDDDLSDAQTELLWDVLSLEEGDEVLDVPCGFASVEGVGHDGKPLTLESRRMIVIATR